MTACEAMTVAAVASTELRAWAREALTAHEVGAQARAPVNHDMRQLINSWKTLTPNMLASPAAIRQHAAQNDVVQRLLRYTERELSKIYDKPANQITVKADTWFTTANDWLQQRTSELKAQIVPKMT